MLSNTSMGGVDAGGPDVCNVPTPGGPVPTPFPNAAAGPMGVVPVVTVLLSCAPAHNVATTIPLTNLDNPGVAMGVASGTVMGPARHVVPSATCHVGGLPATRLTSVAVQNSTNAPGCRVVPCQGRVLCLSA